jgi:hypothetical protein
MYCTTDKWYGTVGLFKAYCFFLLPPYAFQIGGLGYVPCNQCFGSAFVSVRIRIHLFYLNADPNPYPRSQTNADLDLDAGQTLPSQKVGF